VVVVLSDAGNFKLSLACVLDVSAYLTAYFFKFQFIGNALQYYNRVAKFERRTD